MRTHMIPEMLDDKTFHSNLVPADHIRKVQLHAVIEWDGSFYMDNVDNLVEYLGCFYRLKRGAHITFSLRYSSGSGWETPKEPDWWEVGEALEDLLQMFLDFSILGHTMVIDLRDCESLSQHVRTSNDEWVKDMQMVS